MSKKEKRTYKNALLEIDKCKEKGIEISNIKKYCPAQLEQIRLGRENGVDTSIYENWELFSEVMAQIRLGLQEGINLFEYKDIMTIQKKINQIIKKSPKGDLGCWMLNYKLIEELEELRKKLKAEKGE